VPPPSAQSNRLLVFLIAVALAAAGAPAFSQQRAPDPGEVAERAVGLTNDFRAQEGRRKVVVNEKLRAAARYFAGYMAKSGRFSHEADGSNPAARAKQQGYEYCIVSENIAYRYSSTGFTTRELAAGFVEDWEHSPGHRKNMLEPEVTETAVAVAGGKAGHYYAVQMFGRPLAQSIKFSIANRSTTVVRYRVEDGTFSIAPRQTRTHQNCRSSAIELEGAGKVTPKNGDSYAIVQSGSGGFSLKTEQPD